jgi:uncharacterized protein
MEYPLIYEEFQQGLKEGRLLSLQCKDCGTYVVPPQAVCPNCNSWSLSKIEANGAGVIRSFTVIRVAPEGLTAPYIVVLVELDLGPWVVGNLMGIDLQRADTGLIGKRVVLKLKPSADSISPEGNPILRFELEKITR